MKTFTAFCAAMCLLFTGNAQLSFNWAKSGGGSQPEIARRIVTDAAGNVITIGSFSSVVVDFDPGPAILNLNSVGGNDVFLTKLDPTGNLLWAKRIGGVMDDDGFAVVTDQSGNVIFGGSCRHSIDLDPGPGTFMHNGNLDSDAFLCKLDPAGNFIWANVYATPYDDGISVLDCDQYGNIFAGGVFAGVIDLDPGPGTFTAGIAQSVKDAFVTKLTPSGNFLWGWSFGSPSIRPVCLTYDAGLHGERIILAGNFTDIVDVDPGPGTFTLASAGGYDMYITTFNTQGSFLWAIQQGGTLYDETHGVVTDAAGNIYTAGHFDSSVDMDPGPGVFLLNTPPHIPASFVCKLTPLGNLISAVSFTSNSAVLARGLDLNAQASIFVTGHFTGTIDLDPGPGYSGSAAVGQEDVFVAVIDNNLNYVTGWTSGGSEHDNAYSISYRNGFVHIAGSFMSGVDFDPSSTVNILNSQGSADFFIARYADMCSGPPAGSLTISGPAVSCGTPIVGVYSVNLSPGANSYSWTLPTGWFGLSVNSSILITSTLTAGTISVTALNACGISGTATFNVLTEQLSASSSVSGVCCAGQCTGGATVTAQGSTSYQYSWMPPVPTQSSSSSGLCPGNYTVLVTSVNGCTTQSTFSVPQAAPIVMLLSASRPVICQGECSILTATVTGGTGPYGIYWPALNAAGDSVNACPQQSSVYTAFLQDACSCIASAVVSVSTEACTNLNIVPAVSHDWISIYPNPGARLVQVSLNAKSQTISVLKLYSATGQRMYTAEIWADIDGVMEHTIDISFLPGGIYCVSLESGTMVVNRNLVKE